MKKVKVIHLLCHLPVNLRNINDPEHYFNNSNKGKYRKINKPPYWVGFFMDHHVFAAQDLFKLTDEFEIECWRPYGFGLSEPYEEMVNGIRQKVFPAYSFNIPQFGSLTWSDELFDALVEEIHNSSVVLNISVGHAWFHIKLMLKLRKYKSRFALVALQRSGGFRKFSFRQLDTWKKFFKWYYLIESYIDEFSLRYSDVYFVGALPENKYLNRIGSKVNSVFLMEGIDFTKYRVLSKEEKIKLRKDLGLPQGKKILIAYGNWLSTDYGYQHLLEVFQEIKRTPEGDDLEMVMIGGYKEQDLYDFGVRAGAIMVERVDKHKFTNYLEASDFFTQACFSWGFIEFGGFGTAMIEALACGLPVISGNIIHFPGTNEELKEIGLNMLDKKALSENIVFMKNNLHKYTYCRQLAQKYYDINTTRPILLNKYRELAYQYFGVDTSKQNTKK